MKIDFYILDEASLLQAMRFACQLIETMYNAQQKIYIHTNSSEETQRLDKLLWTFRDEAFLPHHIYPATEAEPAPIQIGHGLQPPKHDVLINFNKAIPDFFTEFNHVIEIIPAETTAQQEGRERYRQYREAGAALFTHKIKSNLT